jgi:molybdopterin converting factor subunit 1
MRITVRLFAMQRQQVGWRERALELEDGSTVEDAWRRLVADFPVLATGSGVVRFARNARYADATERLADGDEVAFIPPVAGGAADPGEARIEVADAGRAGRLRRIELWSEPFPDELLVELRRTVPTAEDGAFVLFVGQTRETAGTPAPGQEDEAARFSDRSVEGLRYEAFEEMAVAVIGDIADEVEQRFGVQRLAVLHRTGAVPLGEASVVIATAARQRDAAYTASRYLIDVLKGRAPIWKQERFSDGSVWIGEPARTGPSDTVASEASRDPAMPRTEDGP